MQTEDFRERESSRRLGRLSTNGLMLVDVWKLKFKGRKNIWSLPQILKRQEVSWGLTGSQRSSIQVKIPVSLIAPLMKVSSSAGSKLKTLTKYQMMTLSTWSQAQRKRKVSLLSHWTNLSTSHRSLSLLGQTFKLNWRLLKQSKNTTRSCQNAVRKKTLLMTAQQQISLRSVTLTERQKSCRLKLEAVWKLRLSLCTSFSLSVWLTAVPQRQWVKINTVSLTSRASFREAHQQSG